MYDYYGIAGANGYGVYTEYGVAITQKKYLRKFKMKGFNCFLDAKNWAEDEFEDMQPMYGKAFYIEGISGSDWTYYKKYTASQINPKNDEDKMVV